MINGSFCDSYQNEDQRRRDHSAHHGEGEKETDQIISLQRKLLAGKGRVSHKQAIEKAEKEFEIYRAREMRKMESDFDRAVKQIMDKEK